MFSRSFGQRRSAAEPPIEMRFVDLFMIIVTTLMFMIVMLSIVSAFVGGSNQLAETSPRIISVGLPAGLAHHLYNITLAATGGSNPYKWKIVAGSLPVGLTLDEASGIITGTPKNIQQAQFTLAVIDNDNRSNHKDFSLEILQAGTQAAEVKRTIFVIGNAIYIPDGQVDFPYSFQLNAFGGIPPYVWQLVNGNIPQGILLTNDGQITGNPTTASATDFVVRVKDSQGEMVQQDIHLVINPAPIPIWRRLLSYIDICLKIFGYIIAAILLYDYVFVDRPAGTYRQPEKISLWSRITKRKK